MVDNSDGIEPSPETTERDELIKEASLHVEMAAAQSEFCKEMIHKAAAESCNPHEDRMHVIIIDHSQNYGLPHPGDTQAGKTHCCTPLRMAIFGIVDCSVLGGIVFGFRGRLFFGVLEVLPL